MLHLVYKDIYVNRKYFLLVLLIAALIFFTERVAGMVLPVIMIAYAMLSRSCYNDDLDRGDEFLRSLPIKKSHIVYSKYIFGIGVVVVAFFPFIIMTFIRLFEHWSNIDSLFMAVSMLTVSFMFSVYLPVFFKYGYMKVRSFQTVLYVGLALVSVALSSAIDAVKKALPMDREMLLLGPLNNIAEAIIKQSAAAMVVAMVLSGFLLVLSALISVKLYENRQ